MSKVYLTIDNLRYCFNNLEDLVGAVSEEDYHRKASWVYSISRGEYAKGKGSLKELYEDYYNVERLKYSHPFEDECLNIFESYRDLTNNYVDDVDKIDRRYGYVIEDIDFSNGGVVFHGSDSFYGSWEEERITVPAKFFTDTDNAFEEYKAELIEMQRVAQKELDLQAIQKEMKEIQEYERLKKKYGD